MTKKTGWDMTDEELGARLFYAGQGATYENFGAKIRALFPRPIAATKETVLEWVAEQVIEKQSAQSDIRWPEIVIAALSHFAPPAPTRQDVPSEGEIMRQFSIGWDKYVNRVKPSIAEVYARVARAIMLELAPRKRMMIEGMSEVELQHEFRKGIEARGGESISLHCARIAHRLANTPASDVDEDAGAENMANTAAKKDPHNLCPWGSCTEAEKNIWRAVAKEKGGE